MARFPIELLRDFASDVESAAAQTQMRPGVRKRYR